MNTLYHSPFSVSSQKVRMAMAEKNLVWEDKIIDLLAGEHLHTEFKTLNPRSEVPILVVDGTTHLDSSLILEFLEDSYPDAPLFPDSIEGRYHARFWSNWVDRSLHAASGIITYAILARPLILQKPPEVVDALLQSLPDTAVRTWRSNVLEYGLEASEVKDSIIQHILFFDKLESCLTGAYSWLVGDCFSIADITVFPYVMRAEHVGLGDLMTFESYPNTRSWYLRMMSRPSMQPAFLKYFDNDVQELLMNLVGAAQPQMVDLLAGIKNLYLYQ